MNELVSIITSNYNCERFIEQTIKSVQAQTYQNWEMLIQDDCSTDGSYDMALRMAEKDSRIKVERNKKNSGAAVTRNNAIKRSKGQYLAFLDSDDIWLAEKLEKQLKFMHDNNSDFSFTRYEHISEEGESLGVQANVVDKTTYKGLLHHCWLGCLTVMYKQDLNHKIYGPDVCKSNDYALFLKVIKEIGYANGLNECLGLYRIRKGGISRNKFKKIKPHIHVLHDIEGHNLIKSYYYLFSHQLIKILYKYKKC